MSINRAPTGQLPIAHGRAATCRVGSAMGYGELAFQAAVCGQNAHDVSMGFFAYLPPPAPKVFAALLTERRRPFFAPCGTGRQPWPGQRRGGGAQYAHGRTRVRPGENSSTPAYALEYARGRTRVRPRAHSSLRAAHSSLRAEYPGAPPPNSRGAADRRLGGGGGNGRFATWAAQTGGQALRATPKKH